METLSTWPTGVDIEMSSSFHECHVEELLFTEVTLGVSKRKRVCQNTDRFRKKYDTENSMNKQLLQTAKDLGRFQRNKTHVQRQKKFHSLFNRIDSKVRWLLSTNCKHLNASFVWQKKGIQQSHLFCNTCKTPLWPKNKAIIFVPKRTCLPPLEGWKPLRGGLKGEA